ncbi:MAG: di-trans,poly-cis-decaprenylcistransferase [Synergistaceae bacterium]|nr:di-trans,poly-cis-decaprenylcistransferase [Synergistaceae bacterium]
MPRHVALIMDGNGRWAKKRGLPRIAGHHRGASILEGLVEHASDIGIEYLSVYAFSTENWKRVSEEVSGLMKLFEVYLEQKFEKLKARHGRMRFAGRRDRLPASLRASIEKVEREMESETGIQLILCIDYGGRQEIVDAVRKVLAEGLAPENIDEASLGRRMYLPDVPEPDLIVRTSGEERLSNFWLWSGAYSELYFTDTLWPDFDNAALDAAVASYADRDRRRGGAK